MPKWGKKKENVLTICTVKSNQRVQLVSFFGQGVSKVLRKSLFSNVLSCFTCVNCGKTVKIEYCPLSLYCDEQPALNNERCE